jgi:dephospho-CoA kinase
VGSGGSIPTNTFVTRSTDPEVVAALRCELGDDVIAADGGVRRERVAATVFGDEARLAWLESVLHPRLYAHWRTLFAEDAEAPWIVEVPLLHEKGLENWFDFVVCVTADSATQLRRLEQRGIPPKLALQRMARQMPLARKCELADFVILNDGTIEFLREQVDELAERLRLRQPAP